MKRRYVYTAAIVLLLSPVSRGAQEPSPEEQVVGEALRAALLEEPARIYAAARLRQQAEERDEELEDLAENLEVLALATERPLPLLREKGKALSDYGRDLLTKSFDRNLRLIEPRQRFLEARKDRRYEGYRQAFNGIVSPFASAAQGQFYALFSIPFDTVRYLFIGKRYLTPEQRKELYTARAAAQFPTSDKVGREARETIEDWGEKRTRTVILQAEKNAESAMERNDLETADFWFQKEMALREWQSPQDEEHMELGTQRSRLETQRRDMRTVVNGDVYFYSPDEFSVYTDIIRNLALGNRENVDEAALMLAVDFPSSEAVDEAEAARAAASRTGADSIMTTVYLEGLSEMEDHPSWQGRAQLYMQRVEYSPAGALEESRGEVRERFWSYLLYGDDPSVLTRSYTPEEARMRRESWIASARGFFVTDILSRTIALPFTPPVPRPEIVDTGAQVSESFYETDEGRKWLRRVMKAQVVERQFQDAAESARQLGDEEKAISIERKAARHLEKLADQAPRSRDKVVIYERILNAYPTYKREERVRANLELARIKAESLATIERDELEAYPELWRGEGLLLSPDLLDGRKSNGEIGKDGVYVLAYPAIVYIDRETENRIELPLSEEDHRTVLEMLEPRRRSQLVWRKAKEPLPRRKIPLAVEAGAVPGFDAAPGLVPLAPDPENRALYE